MKKKKGKYRHLMAGYTESGALRFLAANIALTVADTGINAAILRMIPEAANRNSASLLGLIVALCVVNTIVELARDKVNIYRHIAFTHLNNGYMSKMLHADNAMFSKHSPGEILDTGSAMWKFTHAADQIITIARNAMIMGFTLVAIGTLDGAENTLLPIIGIYGIEAIAIFATNKSWNAIDAELDGIRRKRNTELDEIANGFREVRSFPGQIARHWKSITSSNGSILNLACKRADASARLGLIVNSCDTVASMGALAYSLMFAEMTPASAVTFVMLVWRLAEPSYLIGEMLSSISDNASTVPKFNEIMDFENEVPEGTIELASFESGIEFKSVFFGYDSTDTVLSGVTLDIPKGKKVGICGPTGGGKSTICALAAREYCAPEDDWHGVYIDNVNIRDITAESIRRHVGVVHQFPHIFDGTILDNVKYGNPDADMTMVRDACAGACILDFIEGLPEKFNTRVGPRGLRLSGGEKQRIAIARVLLQNPDIIILDEATSALDNKTERMVQKNLDMLDATVIMVAHRLSTIQKCDTIYVIAGHEVVQCGTHDDLMKHKDGLYAKMVEE